MEEHGAEPSSENLALVLQQMDHNYFSETYGGCEPSEVEDYILATADMVVGDLVENEGYDSDEED